MTDQSLLDLLLEPGGINVVFQPVVEFGETKKRLHHLECLARGPVGTNLENTAILFEYVRRKREELLVDLACIKTALQTAAELLPVSALSLNVHAHTLTRGEEFLTPLLQYCRVFGFAEKIIIEVIEDKLPNPKHLQYAANKLREAGFQVALDDFGVKNCNFLTVIDNNPNYIKLDRSLVKGFDNNSKQREVIKTLLELAAKIDTGIIVKGIENEAEFTIALGLGAKIMQGFFFSPPMPGNVLMETSFLQDFLNQLQ
jgi:EAL domain-containing protein (putative c-di-GMP-specific phosphodiesterase class I)